ncbi:uncharacterized protein BJX67DRAFT_373335 [Aspergillus lucknowensis]|uniref:Nucleoside phosphorylase domain-containing protein n=1 Tax=Aspergillus lucknowensis TaxID=176173 RepID=A0ABR4LL27_9EURO
MLDASHAPLPQPKGDHNTYHLGEVGDHNIVIACLPTGVYGLTSAAVVANQMRLTFPSIDIGLMVGIGGGVPSALADIRLGDVVVSKPTGGFSGVVQYDYGKALSNGTFHRTGSLNNPPELLLTAIADLQAKHRMGINNIAAHLESAAKARPAMGSSFVYPGASEDLLFDASYAHVGDQPSCGGCDSSRVVTRCSRKSSLPLVHYGLIASANQVMKDAATRDRLGKELGILCFEMEAAGLMNHFPCLVIRGICDYSDSHKNKQWQDYAASTAAAYARELLQSSVPATVIPSRLSDVRKVQSKLPKSTPQFFGREDELEQVRQAFKADKQGRQAAVIWGLSGYGKTQLALRYITSSKQVYDSILWIDSSSRSIMEESFEQISRRIEGGSENRQSGVEEVLQWLEQDTNQAWIIVFDGVESMDDTDNVDDLDIRDYFPSCDHGHLLLVTTASDLHSRLGFPGIELQGVDDSTGASILMKCAGKVAQNSSNIHAAMSISRKLGGMPLAIEQAGSYLSYGLTPIGDYNRRFQERFFDRTLKTPTRKYMGSYERGRTLWTTFDMLYNALERRSPDSVRLLQLSAFLGRGWIPFNTIAREDERDEGSRLATSVSTGSHLTDQFSSLAPWFMDLRSDPSILGAALTELEESGFVKFNRSESDTVIESFALHDLARSFIQSKSSQQENKEMAAASFFLNGRQLYNGSGIPEESVVRTYMGRLVTVLDQFLTHIPNDMLQAPDGKYFRLCASVAPLYARICRYYGRLETASDLWSITFQYRFVSDDVTLQNSASAVHLVELMEAADIDSRLGKFAEAIDKYSEVVSTFQLGHQDDDDMSARAAGLLRETRERQRQRESDSGRAIAAVSVPKAIAQSGGRQGPAHEEEWEAVTDSEEDDEEWQLRTEYEEATSSGNPHSTMPAPPGTSLGFELYYLAVLTSTTRMLLSHQLFILRRKQAVYQC